MNIRSTLIRILVVDDHPLIREGVRALIANEHDIELAGEASDGREAIEVFRRCHPDVTLMDLQMPGMGGIDALMAIRTEAPAAKVIILTTYGSDGLAQRALKAGAQAYVLKGLVRKELLGTIRAVHAGAKHIHPDVARELAVHFGEDLLTAREIEVLRLVAAGNSNKKVAKQLAIGDETVKAHMKSIMAKLDAQDRTHAVTLALARGLIEL